jgi:predicted ATP-grasp superfamily ATP-dependent carboligase
MYGLMRPPAADTGSVPGSSSAWKPVPTGSVTVLVSNGEQVGVLATVRALRAAGHEPWVAVSSPGGYAARSRAAAGVVEVPDPAHDQHDFALGLAEAAATISAAVVLPGTETALVALAEHADAFGDSVALGACAPDVVATGTDKRLLGRLAAAAGLGAPATFELSLGDDHGHTLSFPVVVKPLRSELGVPGSSIRRLHVHHASTVAELEAALATYPAGRGLVQPYLAGRLVSIAGVAWEGELVGQVQSVAERIWPKRCGTMSYAETVPPDERLTASVRALVDAVGWQGLFQVDLIDTGDTPVLIDLNPRIYTSLAIATAAGVNLPAIWVDLLLGRTPTPVADYRSGVRYRHEETDARALLGLWRSGSRGAAARGLLPRRRTAHAVFSFRDPLPLLTTLGKLGRRPKQGLLDTGPDGTVGARTGRAEEARRATG